MKSALGFTCFLALATMTFAAPVDLASRVAITAANTRSTLDRATNRVTSSVEITITNSGDRAIGKPIQAPVFFTAQSGALDGLEVPGAGGGLGLPPFQTFFFDLSSSIPTAALEPQASVTFTLRFTPAAGARVSYRVAPVGEVNADPVVSAGGSYAGIAGQPVAFTSVGTADPDGDAITFEWNFADGSTPSTEAAPQHTFAAAGFYEVQLTVRDARGASKLERVPVTIAPAAVFGLARTRTLDGSGQPLADVTVNETIGAQTRTFASGGTGFTPLGSAPGSYVWEFSKAGYLTAFREGALAQGATIVANPWLTKLSTATRNYTPLDETPLVSPNGAVILAIAPGVFTQVADAALTDINAQSLPTPLPPGWSPLAAFHFASTIEPGVAAGATLQLSGPLPIGVDGVLAKFNPSSRSWECRQIVAGAGAASVIVSVARSGTYVFVAGDPAPNAPPTPEFGGQLAGTTAPATLDDLTASASATPAVAAASRDAARVTTTARAIFNAAAPAPSGVFFPTRITETYALSPDGSTRTPDYDTTIFAYHRPAGQLAAEFPLRPQLLLGSDELREAVVRVEVLAPGDAAFGGAVLDQNGGILARDGIAVTVPVGALTGPQVAELGGVDPAGFAGLLGGVAPARAFDLNLGSLASPPAFAFSGLTPGQRYVLGLVVSDGTQRGVTPLERFIAGASGALVSEEPATGERLPGAKGGGQYVLVPVPAPLGIVSGIARDLAGQPVAGLAVRVTGQPWLVFSGAGGAYQILAPSGAATLTLFDLRDGNAGTFAANITNPALPTNANLTTAPNGPSVTSTSPAAGAGNVSNVAPITVRFSEPINPATFVSGGVVLTDATAAPVPAALSLNATNTVATLLPTNPLSAGATYSIEVSAGITDLAGLPIEGPRSFNFTVVPADARPPGAQLVVYEPGAADVPPAVLAQLVGYESGAGSSHVISQGSAGVADPSVAVILVNESTGETATVLSKPDGSFVNFINAAEEDFVSATFVNANGTRISVPATRQLFDDGRVGLYQSGGILEAQSDGGPVQVQVAPGTVKDRSVFKVSALGLNELLIILNNTLPQNATLLPGVKIEVEGDKIEGDSDISIPIDPASLNLPPGTAPEDAAFALALPRQVDGETVFQVVDKMRFADGRVETRSPPFPGALGDFLGSVLQGADRSGLVGIICVPLLLGAGPVTVCGRTLQAPAIVGSNALGEAVANTLLQAQAARPLPGAFVALTQPGQQTSIRGRLSPGIVYATSDSDGAYAMVIPSSNRGYVLEATHPRFAEKVSEPVLPLLEFSAAGAVLKDIIFTKPAAFDSNTPPHVTIGHSPYYPAAGGSALVEINASHGGDTPDVIVAVDSIKSLVPGVEVTNQDVQIADVSEDSPVPKRKRWRGRVTCSKTAALVLRITAHAEPGGVATTALVKHRIDFRGAPPLVVDPMQPSDPNDSVGPFVESVHPPQAGYIGGAEKVVLRFNEPISRNILDTPGAITLSTGQVAGALTLSADQQTLEIGLPRLPADATVSVTIPSAIVDLRGNALDQDPRLAGPQSFTANYRTPPAVVHTLPDVTSGGGAAAKGSFLFVLERAGAGSVKVFDISTPAQALPLADLPVPGTPRDLVVIENYSFVPALGMPPVQRDLLVVVGGNLGSSSIDEEGNVFFAGQYLRVFDVTNPAQAVRLVSATVTLRPTAVTKVAWRPPELAYLEIGSDFQGVGVVDLQELIIGFTATPEQTATFPLFGVRGKDLNGDGDYTDAGEQVPKPPKEPAEFFGKRPSFFVDPQPQRLLDFDYDPSGYCGVMLGEGQPRDVNGNPNGALRLSRYKVLAFGGEDIAANSGILRFAQGARPKRMATFFGASIQVGAEMKSIVLTLASLAPDGDGVNRLAVIDSSLPDSPVLLGKIAFPSELGLGFLQSITRRDSRFLEVATTTDIVVLEIEKLGMAQVEGSLHPAVVGIIPQAGSGNMTLAALAGGVRGIALGSRNELVQTAPRMRFVFFPDATAVVNPVVLAADTAAAATALAGGRTTERLFPARVRPAAGVVSTLSPPSPLLHYHVLVDAPGGAGATLTVGLESLNRAGYPLRNKGRNLPPVRALSASAMSAIGQEPRDCDAPPGTLLAHRLSSDKNSPLYNQYLSEPFALVFERITPDELAEFKGELDREILWSDFGVRAFLDPADISNPVVGPFVAAPDVIEKVLRPIAGVVAETCPGTNIASDNPPPLGGELALPGTHGCISANSGEFRHRTIDVALPGRRMPVIFQRHTASQSRFDGPFGRGWDFNYNQQLIALRPEVFGAGQRKPLVVRGTAQKSTIGESGDVQFSNGQGRIILFKNKGTTAPSEFSQDPLVVQLGWLGRGGTFYLPDANEPGVFELLFRFPDGQFVRLTPNGVQFWYGTNGRLEKVYHRYEKSFHALAYTERGELRRITDRSVTAPRFIDIGYFRNAADPTFIADLDEVAPNNYTLGRIARLRDYTEDPKRDVLFGYDDNGTLAQREGPEVAGENGGFSGRSATFYLKMDDCAGETTGITVGNSSGQSATPLFTAAVQPNGPGAPVPQSGNGAGGAVTISVPPENTAANVGTLTTQASGADGAQTAISFDDLGYPKVVTESGPLAASASTQMTYNSLGLLESVTYPEGNKKTFTYDVANAALRSRANLKQVKIEPGPRPGPTLNAEYAYDSRYNLRAGAQTDFNGNTITRTLDAEGKDATSVQYGDAGTHTFVFNEFGQLDSETTAQGITSDPEYATDTGFLARVTRGGNVITRYGYDETPAGLLGRPTSVTPPGGAAVTLVYDNRLQVVSSMRGGFSETLAYDENGNLKKRKRSLDAGQFYEEEREYDQVDFLRKVTQRNVEAAGAHLVTEFTPDAAGRVRQIKYPGGEMRDYTYDHLGFLRSMTIGTYGETYTRDLHGNLTELFTGGELVRTCTYDGHDRRIDVKSKTGAAEDVTTVSYFPNGERKTLAVTGPNGGEVWREEVLTLDALGRVTSEKQSGSNTDATTTRTFTVNNGLTMLMGGPLDATTFTSDAAGRRTGMSNSLMSAAMTLDANGNVDRLDVMEGGVPYFADLDYNALDQLTLHTDGEGTVASIEPRLDGRSKKLTDGEGKATEQDFTTLGELKQVRRPLQIEFNHRHDKNRRPTLTGDKTLAGNQAEYTDGTQRLTKVTYRDGSTTTFDSPDKRNLPTSITFANGAGSIAATYDLRGRVLSQQIDYSAGSAYKTDGLKYDALGRVREVSYGRDGQHSATFTFDKLGPLTGATYNQPGGPFTVGHTINADRTRATVTYPSGITVTEARENNGRLTAISDSSGTIWSRVNFRGVELPGDVDLGGGVMREVNAYDLRKRLIGRRYERVNGALLLAEVRHRYDRASNRTLSQFVHRHGRTDLFAYDDASRLASAEIGARPAVPSEGPRVATGLNGGFGLKPGLFGRVFDYGTDGLDQLRGAASINPDNLPLPAFAVTLTGHDAFLHARTVDGFDRGEADPLGNVKRTRLLTRPGGSDPIAQTADLTYDGLSRLTQVALPGTGVTIDYEYQPDGLMHHRTVRQGTSILAEQALVWDRGRLLEEYDLGGSQATLRARYFYAFGDVPVAADLRGPGGLVRHYYLREANGSIMAVAEGVTGQVVERVRYDAYGQPMIEGRDIAPPRVSAIVQEVATGDLLVWFSEPILPTLSGNADPKTLITTTEALGAALSINGSGGTVTYEEAASGAPFGSVLRFRPSAPLNGALTLQTSAGAVLDEWGNANPAETVNFSVPGSTPPLLVQTAFPPGSTAPPRLARSAIGSPLLFQGQYFDYDAGLGYFRARFYEPYTGQFLQRDPLQYADSVNLYAGLANNPTSLRDPSGLATRKPPRPPRATPPRESGGLKDLTVPDGPPNQKLVTRSKSSEGAPLDDAVIDENTTLLDHPPLRSTDITDVEVDSVVPTDGNVQLLSTAGADDLDLFVDDPGALGPSARRAALGRRARDEAEQAFTDAFGPNGPPKEPDPFDGIPGNVLKRTDDYAFYETPDGKLRIRFNSRTANTVDFVQEGRNNSFEARATLNPQGTVFVQEGRHRAIGAAKGDIIPAEKGGVPGHPHWLDYELDTEFGPTDEVGVPVMSLSIDYNQVESSTPAEGEFINKILHLIEDALIDP